MTTYHIEHRITQTINTDPQRRCYAKTANEWSRWFCDQTATNDKAPTSSRGQRSGTKKPLSRRWCGVG